MIKWIMILVVILVMVVCLNVFSIIIDNVNNIDVGFS